MILIGIVIGLAIIPGPLRLGAIRLSVDTMAAASALVVIGVQAVLFAIFTSVYASNEGFLPRSPAIKRLLRIWTLERGLAFGTVLGVLGASGVLTTFILWSRAGFGNDHNFLALRVVLPSLAALVVSCQVVLGTFFLSILSIRRAGHEVAQEPVDLTWSRARPAGPRPHEDACGTDPSPPRRRGRALTRLGRLCAPPQFFQTMTERISIWPVQFPPRGGRYSATFARKYIAWCGTFFVTVRITLLPV